MDYESLPIERNCGSLSNNANDAVGVTDSPEIGRDSPPPTIYSFVERRRIPRRSRWSLLCWTGGRRRRAALLESDRRAPPAYSALFPRYGRRDEDFEALVGTDRAAVLITGNPWTFVAPTPPPSYAQDQGICVAYSLEQLISNSGDFFCHCKFVIEGISNLLPFRSQ
ncbi:hypothetical protein TSAR_014712 [Trichomalopsis sarcophagae]|uniref:Uncharacterized protein n=1 Tax=Trichomalopsis sarcophagae TaxID=543379 RepID=A0A232F7X6_9HYME|nr:hypothetical protein TSAR_014712 [Trichomalopsis sarcophagae]